MKYLHVFVFVLFSHSLFSQDDKSKSIALYSNYYPDFYYVEFDFNGLYTLDYTSDSFKTNQLSLAFRKENDKGKVQEFELSRFNINAKNQVEIHHVSDGFQVVDGGNVTEFDLGLRYSQIYPVLDFGREDNWTFSLGWGINSNWKYILTDPKTSLDFPSNFLFSEYFIQVIPKFAHKLDDRLSLEFSLPFSLAQYFNRRIHFNSPQIPDFSRTQFQSGLTGLPDDYTVRIGVSYKLNSSTEK